MVHGSDSHRVDFYQSAGAEHKARQKAIARRWRQSPWWKEKLARGVCYYCEGQFPKSELTMDHKIPVARGGRSTKGNLVVSCKGCNTKKMHLTPVEMILNNPNPS